jgi:hypothetical protein
VILLKNVYYYLLLNTTYSKTMQNLSYTYKKIVEKLESHKDHYPEKNLCVFTAASGLSYNRENGLMVIGRSPNGWANFIDKMNPSTSMK